RVLGVRASRCIQPSATNCAGGSANCRTPAAADRRPQSRTERGRDCRGAEPAQVGALRLVSYRLIRELSADRLIALKGGE
ncbi:MAG: hypothetical protein WB509_07955, partial [Acetobacteraceae bacterium]